MLLKREGQPRKRCCRPTLYDYLKYKNENRCPQENQEAYRRDKREAMDQLATEAEEASTQVEQGKVYKITERVCNEFRENMVWQGGGVIMKDKLGKLLTKETELEER